MKRRLKPLVAGLFLTGFISMPGFAAVSADALQKKIDQLQQQVSELKAQENNATPAQTKPAKKHRTVYTSTHGRHNAPSTNGQSTAGNSTSEKLPPRTSAAESDTQASGPDSYITGQQNPETVTQYLPIDIDVPGQSFVSSGPYLGIPLVYSGGNLIINSPNINEDVTLLNMRKSINERLRALGRGQVDDHAHLLLSGIVEAQASFQDPGRGPNSSDVDLTSGELDGYILGPSNWTSGLLAFAYDNDIGTNEGSLNNNSRTQNSRVFLNKAFIVLGNFEKSPLYASFGQMFVPFGTYSSNMVSSPITKILGRTKERAILLGFQQRGMNALYASVYFFKGDSYTGNTSRINDGGVNLGYRFSKGNDFSGDFGAGIIGNLGDSQGIQYNGQPSPFFGGFGAGSGFGNENLVHTVHALDIHGLFSIGKEIDLLVEYVGAFRAFSPIDMTYNSHGARPQAVNAEAAYTFKAFDRPSSIAIGYAKSWEALAVSLPLARYSLVFNTSIWKDTLQSLEFRHDKNYAASAYATGNGVNVTQFITGSGRPDNMVTAQFDLYF